MFLKCYSPTGLVVRHRCNVDNALPAAASLLQIGFKNFSVDLEASSKRYVSSEYFSAIVELSRSLSSLNRCVDKGMHPDYIRWLFFRSAAYQAK